MASTRRDGLGLAAFVYILSRGTSSCQLAAYVYVKFGNTLEHNKSASGLLMPGNGRDMGRLYAWDR